MSKLKYIGTLKTVQLEEITNKISAHIDYSKELLCGYEICANEWVSAINGINEKYFDKAQEQLDIPAQSILIGVLLDMLDACLESEPEELKDLFVSFIIQKYKPNDIDINEHAKQEKRNAEEPPTDDIDYYVKVTNEYAHKMNDAPLNGGKDKGPKCKNDEIEHISSVLLSLEHLLVSTLEELSPELLVEFIKKVTSNLGHDVIKIKEKGNKDCKHAN